MDQTLNQTIRRYLNHQLTASELTAFEQRLASEPNLMLEVSALETLINHHDETLRYQLIDRSRARDSADLSPSLTVISKPRLHYRLAAAAVFAVLIAAVGLLWWNSDSAIASRVYSAHYRPLEISSQLSVNDPTPEQVIWREAVQAYERHDYSTALAKVNQISQIPEYQDQAYLLMGAIHLDAGHPDEAIPALQKVSPQVRRNYEKALFYLALAHLRKQNKPAAEATLNALIALKPATAVTQEASVMLDELK